MLSRISDMPLAIVLTGAFRDRPLLESLPELLT